MKLGRSFLPENMHPLTASDFQFDITLSRWRPWRHFTQKCCHLVSEHKVYARRLCSSVCQFLTYSMFVLVLVQMLLAGHQKRQMECKKPATAISIHFPRNPSQEPSAKLSKDGKCLLIQLCMRNNWAKKQHCHILLMDLKLRKMQWHFLISLPWLPCHCLAQLPGVGFCSHIKG